MDKDSKLLAETYESLEFQKGLFSLPFTKVEVFTGEGADSISVSTDLPSPTPNVDPEPLSFSFRAAKNTGADYVRKNLRVEPRVVDISCTKMKFIHDD